MEKLLTRKLNIFRPLHSNECIQRFGESKVCINRQTGLIFSKQSNSCPPGCQDLYEHYGMKGHNGEDWKCHRGEAIYHSGDFVGIVRVERDQHGGTGVDVISRDELLAGHSIKLRYWHLKSEAVLDGQEIAPGHLIGYGDSTSLSTGCHLHWCLKPCTTEGEPVRRDNGYFGAMDFRPFFKNVFVLEVFPDKKC